MKSILDYVSHLPPAALAALISAAVSLAAILLGTPLRYAIDRLALRHKLKTEYEYGQRKKLRDLIGLYLGRLLEAAESLNHRFWNLYENEAKGWLDVSGKYKNLGKNYYFRTTVYRFLSIYSLARSFELDAIFIDSRIAEKSDLEFAKFLKALNWAITDVALFGGLNYDPYHASDHFFRDQLRQICDACLKDNTFVGLSQFDAIVDGGQNLEPVLRFFDGLRADESRLRWDRIVATHLLLMTFINAFGYDMQRSTVEQLTTVAAKANHREVLSNIERWLPKLGLGRQKQVKTLKKAISTQLRQRGENRNG